MDEDDDDHDDNDGGGDGDDGDDDDDGVELNVLFSPKNKLHAVSPPGGGWGSSVGRPTPLSQTASVKTVLGTRTRHRCVRT